MKAHLPDTLLRLTAIAATVMTLMAALMPFAPALAAPDQGDGYWTDSFSDSTGISASTNISVSGGDVKLALGSSTSTYNYAGVTQATNNHYAWNSSEPDNVLPPALTVVREATNAQYTSISALDNNRWTNSSGNNRYPLMEFIQHINESEQSITRLDLSWNGCSTQTTWNFSIWLYNDTAGSWQQCNNQSITQSVDTWLNYSITSSVANYISSTGDLKWGVILHRTRATNQGYNIRTNYVQAVVTYNRYSTPGSLNSTSITPSNLQSWGNFYANDSKYGKAISITGIGTALTDYQINVSVAFVSGKMNSDFSDLRFIDSSGNMLSYWIESYVASTSAQVWVKVPSIAASGTTTIYMYYGTAAATSASNGSSTFIFFDDFSGDLSKWTKHVNGASINIESGYLNCSGGGTGSPYGHTTLGSNSSYTAFTDGIIDGKVYLTTDSIAEVGYRGNYAANTGYKSRMDNRSTEGIGNLIWPYVINVWAFIPSGGGPLAPPVPSGVWYNFSVTVNGTSMGISCAGQTLTGTNTSYAGPGEISLHNHYGAYSRFDDIRVRKYASPEPATSTGSEVAVSTTYKILRASDNAVLCTITAAQAATGYDISSCAGNTSSIKLRAEFSTGNTSYTPILYDWRVTWTSVLPITIDITAPSNISGWPLDIGNISTTGTLTVNCSPSSKNWYVTANDSNPLTAGRMTLWNGSSYNTSVKLNYAMNVSGISEVTLPSGGTIIPTRTGNYSGIITFKQEVTWNDEPGTYQIVVTFIATTVD